MGMTRYKEEAAHPFFLQLTKEDQHFLLYQGDRISFKSGTLLYQEGDELNDVFIILSGTVRLTKSVQDDKSFVLHMKSKFQVLGEEILFQNPVAALSVEVTKDTICIRLSRQQLEDAFHNNNRLKQAFIQLASLNLLSTQAKFSDLFMYGKTGALYSVLIRLANSNGFLDETGNIVIEQSLTHQEIAQIIGTTRETVNRMITELKDRRILSATRSSIVIHDINVMKEALHCEKCPVAVCTIS
ncbi:Crp/Fnr family transcriptional regulator [Salisediminibacterium beveridgei]|uniref:Transcriptional regulator, Crp/Fnr family n=1 Tax=Salisediminibacterium beveridgei TaxID=632773 RepID=A0A1D7QWJ5_9BACI|nr:Crp/Fnr family transcriptional regulator [Salisediminibacterium beveridgei]AOM83384.1 transcriptional regulator, Crp/Fnr family [Salisediminibacterium beveridgei]